MDKNTGIKKIKERIKTGLGNGIFHDSRSDVNALASYCNMITDKINEIIDFVERMKTDIKEIEKIQKSFQLSEVTRKNTPNEIRAAFDLPPLDGDIEKVVRCKDCVYYEKGKDYTPYCNHINGLDEAKDNDFCSYGERKRW